MKTDEVGIINDKVFKYGIITSLFLVGIGIYKLIPVNITANVLPNYSNQETQAIKIYKEKPEYQEIQIPDKGLSKLIEIPGGRCFWVKPPGWIEPWFLNETKKIPRDICRGDL